VKIVVGLAVVALAVAAAAGGSVTVGPQLDAQKRAILDHQFAVPVGAAAPAPKNPRFVPPVDPPRAAVSLRRVTTTDVQAPIGSTLFEPSSQWVDLAGGMQTAVYAGQQGETGAVYVWISDLTVGQDLPGTGLFVAKEPGPFVLTSVAGNLVRFTRPNGTGTFDLGTHVFRFAR
jgi:hypothetical protein